MGDTPSDGYHVALASPVRRRMLALLQDGPLTAPDLAGTLGLHVTTARFHLDQLCGAGLVTREHGREQRRGRPSTRYRAIPGDPAAAREDLIHVLTEALAERGGDVPHVALAAGERWAGLLDTRAPDATTALTAAFTKLGFGPEATAEGILLHSCPFRDAAREHPEVVCEIHLGLARRLAALQPGEPIEVGLQPFVQPDLCLVALAPQGGVASSTLSAPATTVSQ